MGPRSLEFCVDVIILPLLLLMIAVKLTVILLASYSSKLGSVVLYFINCILAVILVIAKC